MASKQNSILRVLGKIPLLQHLRQYSWKTLRSDARSGVNVALLDFPVSMAFALIAGLPVQVGIYSSALGSITGPVFASSRYLMLGPSNASAVLLLSGFLALGIPDEQKLVVLPILVLMIGLIMIAGALLRVEIIIQYVSRTVITGYISAAAFLIVVNQLRHVFGLTGKKAGTFFESLEITIQHLPELDPVTTSFSLITALIFLTLKRFTRALPNFAITLVLMAVIYQLARWKWGIDLNSLPQMDSGTWPVSIPHFDFDLIKKISSMAFAIAFLTMLESASIAKTLAAQSGESINIRQQMFSMGVSDLVNSVGSGMPVSGSLTRSALNWASGAKTPVSSMISGSLLVVGVLTLGPMISYIPKSALATLVILVGIRLINIKQITTIFRTTRSDALTFSVTFICGLFLQLDMAIYLGVGISIILFLKKVAQPILVEVGFNDRGEITPHQRHTAERPAVSIVHVEGDLFFGSTDVFLQQMRTLVEDPHLKVVVLRLLNAHHLDATAAFAIGDFINFARKQNREVILSGVHPEFARIIKKSGLEKLAGPENIYHYTPDNVTLCTRNALKRAQLITGNKSPDIILFTHEKKNEKTDT